jgi:catechol 2,3-dioxygenase-like lactoylglutathione lyase family enzyme
MLRFEHVGVVVDDLDAATAFFLALGFEHGGSMTVDGEAVDRINGLDGVRADLVMMGAPDGGGGLEIVSYRAPADAEGAHPAPPNRPGFRHIAIEIQELNALVDRLREMGYGLVGEACDYGGYRLCYVDGPEGLIVELAQRIAAPRQRSAAPDEETDR